MMPITPAVTLNRLSLSELHTKHRISPSLPVRRNLLIKLNCAEMELANSLILAQTCRAGSRVNKDEQYSGSAEHYRYAGSVVIRNGCNNENQQVTGKEKGSAENTTLEMVPFLIHEENQRSPVLDCKINHDSSNLSYEVNQQPPTLDDGTNQHIRTCEIFVGHRVTVSKPVQPFGSMLEQSTNLPKPLDSGSGHNLTSPDTSPFSHVMPALPKYKAVTTTAIQSNLFGILCKLLFGPQPFSSISRCLSSFLIMRFIQAASDSSPSCRWASSIKSRSSGSSRNWNGGLPRLSFLCVDTLSTPDVMCLCVMTHYMHMNEKATPRSAETLPRRLTTNDSLSIEVAMLNHTPTRFKFLFLAVCRSDLNAKPHRESVTAHSEQDARRSLAGQFVLSFAGRLPEVNHA